MTIVNDFQTGVNEALKFGQQIRIKYYNTIFGAGSYYDDNITLSKSGSDLWTSGVILPISQSRGSSEAVLLEQGKLFVNDTKLYIQGTVNTSGELKIGLGSPVKNEYFILTDGVMKWDVNEVPILKKVYLRRLSTGSLVGES
jgi:hypothetical protein